jgi:hypothetical protein
MDISRLPVADPRRDIRAGRFLPAADRPIPRQDGRRRPGCRDVARNRTARYVRRRRIPRLLWPLIATFVLIGLIFERRPFSALSTQGTAAPDSGRMPPEDRDIAGPHDTGSAAGGVPEPRYRPPADFLATDKEVAQIVAFIIRNRGRIDNDAVRKKWEILDRASLPLAVHLREVEANAAWDDLEQEISSTPPGIAASTRSGLPKSIRHRKLLQLMPEWTRRGEDLMTGESAADVSPDDPPTLDGDDGPNTRPRKP